MAQIAGLPYYELAFAADGTLSSDDGLPAAVSAGGITDLFVFSHGWNASTPSARGLYKGMFTLLSGMLGPKAKTSAVAGVLWPSLLFPEDDPGTPDTPSTGAQLASALQGAFPGHEQNLAAMGSMLDQQPQDAAQLQQFHQLASGLVTSPGLAPEDEGPQAAITADTSAVFGHAAAMAKTPASGAQGLSNPFTTMWSGAREVLRSMSYYEMKNRAGVIGRSGLGPLLAQLAPPGSALRIHLMGHSFGARLVSFSLAGLPAGRTGGASPVKSLTLIQGAFSHFSFAHPTPCQAVPSGALAGMLSRVDGPMLSTFTAADRAVGWWYPAASMLAHQNAQSLTDLTYEWGGMGHDGFQQSSGSTTLELTVEGFEYGFTKGGVYRLDANNVINAMQSSFSGAHSDIQHPEMVWAVVSAAAV
ncbi:MAG: serine/threonine protein kinase [Actinomycetota bacterium]